MPAAALPAGQPAQTPRRVVVQIACTGLRRRVGIEQQVAIFRREQEEQAVDHAQQLAVILLRIKLPGAELLAQGTIGRVRQKAAPQRHDGLLHAAAQVVQYARALLLRSLYPPLQPAVCRSLCLDPRFVTEQPQQDEIGVGLALHHGFEVELNVRRA
jgi:hypothetical protein